MLNKEDIRMLEQLDKEYVIGGSQAVMLYVGKDIRECNDLDLHTTKQIQIECISIPTEVFIDRIPYQNYNGTRLIKIENLMANKINRFVMTPMWKDIYDVYYLMDVPYDKELLCRYIDCIPSIPEDMDFSQGLFPITRMQCEKRLELLQ